LDIQNGNQMEAALKMINCAPEIKLSRDHLFKATGEPPFAIVDRNACFPAIAIPVEKKDHFECPIEHVRFLQDFIPKVSKILVIGWKAAEMHFRRLLEGLNGVQSVMVVDPMDSIDQTVATFRQIKPFPGTVQFERLKCGFSQAIVTQQIDSFLNS